MDIHFYLQGFEASMRTYFGNDPLDSWDKFVDYLVGKLPSEDQSNISVVLDRLVQTFMEDKRYHNDIRYINHCIKCASFYPDPIQFYSHVHACGIGMRTAALYVSWAEQYEKGNQPAQAEQVYQRGLENLAEPLEVLQHHYSLFQRKTVQSQTIPSDAVRNPLQNSQLVNQQLRQREFNPLQPQCKEVENALFPAVRTVCIVSRSDNNLRPGGSSGSATACLSMYCVDELVCEGSELSFEELKARRYFSKLRQQEQQRQQNEILWRYEKDEEEVVRMKQLLEELNSKQNDEPQQENAVAHPWQGPCCAASSFIHSSEELNAADQSELLTRASMVQPPSALTCSADVCMSADTFSVSAARKPADLTHVPSSLHLFNQRDKSVCASREELHSRESCVSKDQQQDRPVCDVLMHKEPEGNASVEMSHSGLNHSHITPNSSLGLITATPSRALPSPTVHTREALDLISHMFQVPTLLPDTLFNTTTTTTNPAEDDFERNTRISGGPPATVNSSSSVPFRIYQDENVENNKGEEQKELKKAIPAAPRALMESHVSKANFTPLGVESLTDDSAMWGARRVSMGTCPNHTRDFALSAHLVSTPLHPIGPFSWDTQLSQDVPQSFSGAEEHLYLRQPAKLSPILEQSPPEEKQHEAPDHTLRGQGTVVGECESLQRHNCNQSNTTTLSRQSLAPLCFPDQSASTSTRASWSIYPSPNSEHKTGRIRDQNVLGDFKLGPSILQDIKPDQLDSSTRPGFSVSQSLEQPDLKTEIKTMMRMNSHSLLEQDFEMGFKAAHGNSNAEFDSRRLDVLREPELLNSSSLRYTSNDEGSARPKQSFYQSLVEPKQNREIKKSLSSSMILCDRELNSNTHSLDRCTKPSWSIYQSPEKPKSNGEVTSDRADSNTALNLSRFSRREIKPDQVIPKPGSDSLFTNSNLVQPLDANQEQTDVLLPKRSFHQRKSLHQLSLLHQQSLVTAPQSPKLVLSSTQDVPMSPEPVPGFGWLQVDSPIQTVEPDLDVMVQSSPQTCRPSWNIQPVCPVLLPMSPGMDWICSESPECETEPYLEVRKTPYNAKKSSTMKNILEVSQRLECDEAPVIPVEFDSNSTSSALVPDPWDEDLIASLLSGLRTPLSSHPNLSVWSCSLPSITPKMTVELADECLRVDFVLGQGAFAIVYQVTNLNTSQKLILKVQKPPNPWEFYINLQLNERIEPRARHLYNQLHSAHLFSNGSVLIGDPYTCGTLLNVVNLYKNRSEKVMPQPLVLYFTLCILNLVERLHASRIIHADIKPDNFLLGEGFLKNENFEDQNLHHGLVLIDFGQSIDMSLFPDGCAFTARCMTSGFQCTEMLSNRPWTYQTDYFGVAGTVHCMLFGSYMQVRYEEGVWKTNGVFKRNPHRNVWQHFFHTLLNISDCASLPCLRSLRELLSATLQDNYSNKLRGFKNRLVVQILESKPSRR